MFNEARLWERAQTGADGLWFFVVEDGHPRKPLGGEPYCTHSLTLSVRDDAARQIARAHCYRRPDGSYGLEGRPDPKMVRGDDGTIYWTGEPPDPA
jgi:hypothetical protein